MANATQITPFVLNNLISVKTASDYSNYSQQYLRRMLRLGKLAGLKIGQVWLIDKESLDIYLSHALNSEDQRFCPK
jgi:excisionase family DNA binding protein